MPGAPKDTVQAYFTGIREAIAEALAAARSSIVAAVAWISDPELFDRLVTAAGRGVQVRLALLDDDSAHHSRIGFERLTAAGGIICRVPEPEGRAGGLRSKYCVIDHSLVITGSFDWTRHADEAEGTIVVVREDDSLAAVFEEAFAALLRRYGHEVWRPVVDTGRLMQRLNVIRNLLLLDDVEALRGQIAKLDDARIIPAIAELATAVEQNDWPRALALSEMIQTRGVAVVPRLDPEIVELRAEAMGLEVQLVAFAAEQAELDRLIREFDRRRQEALGSVLVEYLRLRHEILRRKAARSGRPDDREAEASAAEDLSRFREASEAVAKEPHAPILTDEARAELKQLFRAAALRCHPDRVADADKAVAQGIFIRIQEAYSCGDLETLRKIHRHLAQGRPFADEVRGVTEVDKLRQTIARLSLQVAEALRAVRSLRASETYRTLAPLSDWEEYFVTSRRRLESEIDRLLAELEQSVDA
jgi:hypothetical protein